MSRYLVRFDGAAYANDELYVGAVARGERAFTKMLAKKEVVGKALLDQVLYPLTLEQREACTEYTPTAQDFDEAYRCLNIVSRDTVKQVKEGVSAAFPGASVITLSSKTAPESFKYRHVSFIRVRDYKGANKYRVRPNMAAIRICGRLYIALNAVDVRVETPVIVTIDD
jgi:hypothetical protein